MHNLKTSSKKLQVIHTATRLFVTYGFHTTGVDLIIKEAKITKATFYNYFHSKEREPYRVCRRVNILRDYPDDKTKLYPRN